MSQESQHLFSEIAVGLGVLLLIAGFILYGRGGRILGRVLEARDRLDRQRWNRN